MPLINFIKKVFKKFLIGIFLSFVLYQGARGFFSDNEIAKMYIEKYEKFLTFSEEVLKEKIPGLENYLAEFEKAKQEKALNDLMNGNGDILDRMGNAFYAMDKYVTIQKGLLILKNPELAKEFSTAGVGDVIKSIDAMKNYKKMQEEVYGEIGISDSENYMNFQEIVQYSKIIEQINRGEKTENDLIYFLENLSNKTKETEDLKSSLLKVGQDKVKEGGGDLKKVFEKTFDKNFSEDFIMAE